MTPTAVTCPRRRALAAVAVVGSLTLTGCFTGQRPTLAEAPTTTGEPAVDSVLALFDAVGASTFTATYAVTTTANGTVTPATAVQSAPTRRSVTIGAFRFVFDGSATFTCDLEFGDCSDTISTDLIADVGVAPDFFAVAPASQLRQDAAAPNGAPEASTREVAGQTATCVTVPLTNSTSTYCALPSGALARLEQAEMVVELTAYSAVPDESAFELPA